MSYYYYWQDRRKVPVILTEDVKAAIIVLNKSRQDCKLVRATNLSSPSNMANQKIVLTGHDVLQKTCAKVQLEQPNLVKTTNLRKYVATVSQLVDINESEMGWLANHLGHDIHVHKEFYRLPQTTLHGDGCGRKFAMAVDEGRLHLFKGKNPRDIKLAALITHEEDLSSVDEYKPPHSSDESEASEGELPQAKKKVSSIRK
ncbi:Hypothetical predicted protein [Paramuricea clavata]|uniref:Uncharacterized protein n=1 Tax=Paramuricea clavata TaxID=317549 RepID=A0A7D9L5X5_PARCT|nr:Hypothetical predicted protein [Paramuricea clavata]